MNRIIVATTGLLARIPLPLTLKPRRETRIALFARA
jgi:hypothetical protein